MKNRNSYLLCTQMRNSVMSGQYEIEIVRKFNEHCNRIRKVFNQNLTLIISHSQWNLQLQYKRHYRLSRQRLGCQTGKISFPQATIHVLTK